MRPGDVRDSPSSNAWFQPYVAWESLNTEGPLHRGLVKQKCSYCLCLAAAQFAASLRGFSQSPLLCFAEGRQGWGPDFA